MSGELRTRGIELKEYGIPKGPLFCTVSEDDPRWPDVLTLLQSRKASGSSVLQRTWTEFTQEERDAAEVLLSGACWTHGYPEPADLVPVPGTRFLPYFPATYDLSTFCTTCFSGAKQKAPFRMKREPAWGRRSIMQLNWIPDELFVKTEVWNAIFRPFRIGQQPVLLHKDGAKLSTVVQLMIPQEVALDVADLPGVVCPACRRKKYDFVSRGFPPPPLEMLAPMAKSLEYFGTSDASFKQILVANSLYQTIKRAGLKGAIFEPTGSGVNSFPLANQPPHCR